MDARQQTAQRHSNEHLQREVGHAQRGEAHALHALVEESQRGGGLGGEDANAVGEEDGGESQELGGRGRGNQRRGYVE